MFLVLLCIFIAYYYTKKGIEEYRWAKMWSKTSDNPQLTQDP